MFLELLVIALKGLLCHLNFLSFRIKETENLLSKTIALLVANQIFDYSFRCLTICNQPCSPTLTSITNVFGNSSGNWKLIYCRYAKIAMSQLHLVHIGSIARAKLAPFWRGNPINVQRN